jgi:chromosome segregation ATPase
MQKSMKSIFGKHHGLDEKSVEILSAALEKNNLPGFDYIEFKQALFALFEKVRVDEPTAFKSAFATAGVMGLTKEKLLETAEYYREVLTNEKQLFEAALQNQIEQRIVQKQQEVIKLQLQIEANRKAIADLEKKVAQANDIIAHADGEIEETRLKIENTRSAFENTLQSIMNQIQLDIEQIQRHL